MLHSPEENRIRDKKLVGSFEATGNNGLFILPNDKIVGSFFVIWVETEPGFIHMTVTVNRKGHKGGRAPNTEELTWVKEQFWDKEDVVVQYFVGAEGYQHINPAIVNLYECTRIFFPVPPSVKAGIED